MPPIIMIGAAIAGLLLLVGIIVTLTGQRSLIDERLESYLGEEEPQADRRDKGEKEPSGLTLWLSDRVETTSFGERIGRDLARADLKLKTGEFIALMAIAAVLTGIFGFFFGGNSIIFAILGAVFGLFIPRFYVRYLQRARLKKFNDQLPDMLNLMVNGLRTGFSAMQAMEAVSRELPSPISDEFRRVVQEMQLGVAMEAALDNLYRRIPSDDLDLAITAINIQREVGGNLAEILDTISYTIRERIRIFGEVKAVTAQVAYSGRFLALMPVILTLALWALNREYMEEFFQEPVVCGYLMFGVSIVMLVIGYVVMNRIADIEI